MQIKTLFHNTNFLKKSTQKADARARARKAGRRFVCVLMLLVMGGAAWGADYRKKAGGGNEWATAGNWDFSTDNGSNWSTATKAPGSGDTVLISGDTTFEDIVIYLSNENPLTIKSTDGSPHTLNASKFHVVGYDGGNVNIILDKANIATGDLRINDDDNVSLRYDGTITFSGNNSTITATTVMVFGDSASSPAPVLINFTTIPVTVYYRFEINWDETVGVVEVATDASIGGSGSSFCIGKSDSWWTSQNETATVFSGTGTITTDNINFPAGTSHHIQLNDNFSLDVGTVNADGSGEITIDGSGNLDITNQVNGSTVSVGSELNVGNLPSNAKIYTYTLEPVNTETFPTDAIAVTIRAKVSSGEFEAANKTFTYTLEKNGTGTASFSFASSTSASGSVTLGSVSSSLYSGTFNVECSGTISSGEGFILKIFKPGGSLLGTVSWTKEGSTWTGAVSHDWGTAVNWSGGVPGATDDVEIPNVTNYPIIAAGQTVTIASLTCGFAGQLEIGDNVTLSVGSLSIGSWGTVTTGDNVVINCTGTQSDGTTTDFTGSGTLVANGSLKFVGAGTTSINTLTINGPASGSSDATFEYQGGNARISSLNMTGQVELKTGSAGTLSVVGTARATDNARLKVTESTGTVSFAYLQADTDKTLTLGSAVTVSGELINWGTVVLDAYPLTVNTYSAATGTVTINGPASGTAAVFTLTGTTDAEISALNVSGLAELKTTASGALKVTGTTQIIDDATLTLTSGSGAVTLTAVTVDEGKSLNLKNAVTLTALTNKGTIVLENGCDLTVPAYTPSASQADIISLSGTVALNVTGTVSTVTVTDSATLSGTFSCRKFTASGLGGKTLTLNGTATVGSGTATDALVLSGSSEASKLTVTGSGTIKLNKAQAGGQYLSVSTAGPFIKDLTGGTGCVYTATYSSSSSGTATEFNGWNLCPAGLIYKWTGAAGTTAWNTAGNWNTSMVPSERENDVEIPAGCSVYPVSPSSELSINSLTVESGASVSVADGVKLRFVSYSGDGVIKLGTGNIEIRQAGTNCTIQNIEFTGTGIRDFAVINKVTLVNLKVPSGKTLRLSGNLTLTGELDNAGTVNTNGQTLTFKTYTGTGTVQIGTAGNIAVGSGGTGGEIQKIEFTGSRSFANISGISFKDATIAAGKELKLSGTLTFTGTVTNNGTLNIDNKAFTCVSYSGSGSDRILSNGGILTAGGGTIKTAQLTGNSKVINNGTGNLVFTAVTVTADNSNLTVTNSGTGTLTLSSSAFTGNATLTAGGTGSMPVFTTVSVGSGKTLTLGSNLTVSDTLGNQGTIAVGPYALSFAKYTNTAATKNDALTVNGGSVTSTGTGTGSGYAVNRITLSGNASINKNGMGALKVTKVAVAADATLTVTKGGSATSMPELTEITVGSSSFTVGGSGFAAGTLTATDSSVTIGTGVTLTVDTFTQTVSGSGKSLTVNGTLIVGSGTSQETFRLSGGGTGSRLSVAGTGTIKLNTSQVGGNYLSVSTPGPAITQQNDGNDIAFTAVNSTPSTGAPEGWNICAGDLTFIWKGSAGTNGTAWNVPENWSVHVVPNSGTHTGITGSTAINVEIPAIPVQPSTSGDITVSKLTVAGGMTLTLGGRFTVSGALTNSGTIDMKNRNLTCGSYADSTENGLIKLGTGTLTTGSGGTLKNIEYTATRSFGNISGLTIKNGTVDSGVALTVTSGGLTFGGTLTNGGTITQNGNLSVNGALTNNGVIDMQDKNLTCGSYADDGNNRLIKLGTGTLNPGTGGTLNNIEFTATRSFEKIANLTITNGILDADKTLTITSGGLSFTGNFTNNGTITQNGNLTVGGTFTNKGAVTINNKALTFGAYSRTGTADSLSVTGGTISSTDNGGTVSSAVLNGTVTVKKTGTGAFTLSSVTVTADGTNLTVTNDNSTGTLSAGTVTFKGNATLTAGGTGSMPAFTTVSVGSGKTLTLNSALNAGTLTNNGTVTASSGTLAVTGTLTNNGSVVAAGFNLSAGTLKNNGNITFTAATGGNSITGTYTKDTGVTQDKLLLTGNVTLTIGTNQVSTITYGGGTLTAAGTGGIKAGSLSVTGTSGSATLAGTMNVAGDLTAAPALTIAGSVSVGGNLTAASDVVVSGSTGVTGTLKVTDGSVTVGSGATLSAGKFTATGLGGKSLTVNGTLTVGSGKTTRDTFRISGISGNPLVVDGSGTIRLNLSQVGGDYLSLISSNLEVTQIPSGSDIVLTAIHSTGPTAPATLPSGWNLCADELTFIWKGGWSSNPTAWNEEHNWSVHIVPNADSSSNGEANVSSVNVEIPSVSYSPKTSGAVTVKKLTMAGGMTLELNDAFTVTTDLTSEGSITVQSGGLTVQNNLTTSGSITQNSDVTVTAVLTNSGTIDMKNRNLTCGSYVDSTENGLIKLGTGTFNPGSGGTLKNIEFTATRSFENISGLTIKNGTGDSGVALSVTSGGLSFTGAYANNGTITQTGNLSVTGALTNNGTIDMQDSDLSCGSYTDDANNRWVKLGKGTFNPGTGGTLNNIEFTATRSFEDISGLTITNGILDADKTLTITSGGLSFTGNFTNNGTIMQNGNLTVGARLDNTGSISIGSQLLQFGWYIHTDTLDDVLSIAGGSITSTGNGTGMLKINSLLMNGNAAVTNNGTGALRFEAVTVNRDAQLTSGGSGSAPVYSNLHISGSNSLTLASDVTAGSITIDSAATLNADNRGKNADPNFAGYVLTVSGNFINNNTTAAETDNVQYRGFIPQSGKVVFTGNGGTRHEIKGNNKFNDFMCHEPGASLVFDVGTTTNVDHLIDVAGTAGQLVSMTTDSTVDGEKWTLDVVWDVAAGTPEHPKPLIKYVAPHKSISYSAILKGCLDNCVDDVNELLDSTNVNWFNDMPTILMTMASVGGRQLFVLFSTEVSAASGTDLRTSVALKSGSSASIIDTAVPVTSYSGTSDKAKTAVVFGLTRDLTWNDLYGNDCLHVEIVQTGAVRVGSTRISYQQGVKHCTSDFAVNAARMLYGYDNYIDSATPLTAEKGVNSVRTWDQSDPISNRLHSDSDLLFQAQFDSSVPEGMRLEMVAQLASQLNASVIGDNYSGYYELATRLWLPEKFMPLCTEGQTLPSSQHIAQDATSAGRLRNFALSYSASSTNPLFRMMDGEEIQFMFKVKNPDGTDLMIDHDYDADNGIYEPTPERPVYAIRLVDDSDIMSFDLWSVVLQETTLQRGNVTILNNVINSDLKEQTFVTIDMQKAGNLTVQVLTLDGAVVKTLQKGRKTAGTHGYGWDGTNGSGKPVARGMYFIRVIGPDIDETRKVMVVRN